MMDKKRSKERENIYTESINEKGATRIKLEYIKDFLDANKENTDMGIENGVSYKTIFKRYKKFQENPKSMYEGLNDLYKDVKKKVVRHDIKIEHGISKSDPKGDLSDIRVHDPFKVLRGKDYKNKPEIINISDQPLKINFDVRGMKKLIFLPDYSPSRGKLPVGTVAVFDREKHIPSAEYLGPDIGCGMLLAKFKEPIKDLEYSMYNLKSELMSSKRELGSLGGGNHFIGLYEVAESETPKLDIGTQTVLIHSGSRLKGKEVFDNKLKGSEYFQEYKLAVNYGKSNRKKLLEIVEDCTNNKTEIISEQIHNSVEVNDDDVIYRKGAIKLSPNDLGIISSSMIGDAILITPQKLLYDLENSICHGTGRKISRSEAKKILFDSGEIRNKIYIPNLIIDEDIQTEAPYCYRDLKEIMPNIKKYIFSIGKLKPLSHVS